jgi:hypothetical protein
MLDPAKLCDPKLGASLAAAGSYRYMVQFPAAAGNVLRCGSHRDGQA